MKCIDSRVRKGLRWRRYRTDIGDVITTVEIPASAYLGMEKRLLDRIAGFERTRALAVQQHQIDNLVQAGWKPLAIANELGVSTGHVQRRKRRLPK